MSCATADLAQNFPGCRLGQRGIGVRAWEDRHVGGREDGIATFHARLLRCFTFSGMTVPSLGGFARCPQASVPASRASFRCPLAKG